MAHQLQYRYTKGERLAYTTTVHAVVVKEPGATGPERETVDLGWRSQIEVTGATAELFSFRLIVTGETGQPPQICTFSHSPLGEVRSEPTDVEGYQKPLKFPAEPIEVGASWSEEGLEITLDSVEGDIAVLTAECDLQLPIPDVEGRAESTTRFSISRGRPIDIKGVTLLTFSNGRRVTTTADSKLQG